MAEYLIKDSTLTAIANAIRAKTGTADPIAVADMATQIEGITTGGGSSADCCYVTFRNEATGEEFVKPVATGDDCVDVVAKGLWAKPTKPSDAQYDYTYYGWGASDGGAADANILKNITEDKTVYAIFTGTLRSYTITWLDDDGSELKSETLLYGAMPSYEPTKDNYTFKGWTPAITAVTGDASYTASWVVNGWQWDLTDGVLTISGSGPMDNFSSADAQPWANDRATITSIVIEDGVTRIGKNAFRECTNVTAIEIPDGEYIDSYAFYGCSKLTSIDLSATRITGIAEYTFDGCTALSVVKLPATVKGFYKYAFGNCSSLKSITIPASVTSIQFRSFLGAGLTSAIFEDTTSGWTQTLDNKTLYMSDPGTAAKYLVDTYAYYSLSKST